jgi:hypothetical protein
LYLRFGASGFSARYGAIALSVDRCSVVCKFSAIFAGGLTGNVAVAATPEAGCSQDWLPHKLGGGGLLADAVRENAKNGGHFRKGLAGL